MYPQLLTWKAKKANVDENVAKILWNTAEAIEACLGEPDNYLSLNRRFDALLDAVHFSTTSARAYAEIWWGRRFTKMMWG